MALVMPEHYVMLQSQDLCSLVASFDPVLLYDHGFCLYILLKFCLAFKKNLCHQIFEVLSLGLLLYKGNSIYVHQFGLVVSLYFALKIPESTDTLLLDQP